LAKLQPPALLVADETFQAWIHEQAPANGHRSIRDVDLERSNDELTSATLIVVASLTDERGLLERVAALAPRAKTLGVKRDVYSHYWAGADGWLATGAPPAEPSPPGRRYMVLCTPRAGSTWLCDHLIRMNLGNPREHIRPHLNALAGGKLAADLAFPELWTRMERFDQRGGVFGTKAVAHLLEKLIGGLPPEGETWFRRWVEGTKLVYLFRRDRVLQAISQHRARTTKVFHVMDPNKLQSYRENAEYQYDFEGILRNLRQLAKQEEYLVDFLRRHAKPAAHVVTYESLLEHPERELTRLRTFLGDSSPELVESGETAGVMKLRDDRTEAFAARFCEDYRSELGSELVRMQEPPEIEVA
jgi:LPS sulfotransferase NodH